MDVGETWAYQERSGASLVPAEILAPRQGRPPRVQVRFLDGARAGREELVPPGRLLVLWENRDAWLDQERRWTELTDASRGAEGTPEFHAVVEVLCTLPETSADFSLIRAPGVLHVEDVGALVAATGVDPAVLTGDSLTISYPDGSLDAPFRVAVLVAQQYAQQDPQRVLAHLATTIAQREHEAVHGNVGRNYEISAQVCAQLADERRPADDVVRRWCGEGAVARYDEVHALRAEARRLAGLTERAISALERAGDTRQAAILRKELNAISTTEFGTGGVDVHSGEGGS